jgi:hypothetical protein
MEVDLMYAKGGKGGGRGKGAGRGAGGGKGGGRGAVSGGLTCFRCGGAGHRKSQCPSPDPGVAASAPVPAPASAPTAGGADAKKGKKCYNCGKMGHFAKECRSAPKKAQVGQLAAAEVSMLRTSERTGGSSLFPRGVLCDELEAEGLNWPTLAEEEDLYMLTTSTSSTATTTSSTFVVCDSGSMVHAVPVAWLRAFPSVVPVGAGTVRVSGAGGEVVKHYGRIHVQYDVPDGNIDLEAEVLEISRPIASVARLIAGGAEMQLGATQSALYVPRG